MKENQHKNKVDDSLCGKPRPELSCCVVWTSIPILSWVCPAFGHVGICDSSGYVYDFQGDYHVRKGKMFFGEPKQKFRVMVEPKIIDEAIKEVSQEFTSKRYDFINSNCHFFVESVLDRVDTIRKQPKQNWIDKSHKKLVSELILKGRSLTVKDFLSIWIPLRSCMELFS